MHDLSISSNKASMKQLQKSGAANELQKQDGNVIHMQICANSLQEDKKVVQHLLMCRMEMLHA